MNRELIRPKLGLKPGIEPSEYQWGVIEWLLEDEGNAFCEAVAGSGKTWLLTRCADLLTSETTQSGLFCAFNKHIAVELAEKLKHTRMRVSTIHSAGFRTIARTHNVDMDDAKYKKHGTRLMKEAKISGLLDGVKLSSRQREIIREVWPNRQAHELFKKARVTLTPFDDQSLRKLAIRFGQTEMLVDEDLWFVVMVLFKAYHKLCLENRATIDFDDQVYLPNVDARYRCQQYPWVFVDEAQDLNAAQRGIVARSLAPGGRLLAVGDRRQAIYAFSGADSKSVQLIVEEFRAKVLPLSICYRCPRSHLDLAREIVPQIEAAPNAIEGEILHVRYERIHEMLTEGDLVVCRTTAPLVTLCYELIKLGVNARVRGRNIGDGLIGLINQIDKRYRSGDVYTLLQDLAQWAQDEIMAIVRANDGETDDPEIEAIRDRTQVITVIARPIEPSAPIADLTEAIQAIFSDETPSVWLSTVHRAKGLEADRVFILREELMPLPFVKDPEQLEQEWNLRYVALTRAKRALVFIDD